MNPERARSTLSVVIHGHFYQPPREDPWLEILEAQPSAAPYHDWNDRIEQECYRAVTAARLPDAEGRIASILNTLELISFNFGPTLLGWMEEHAVRTYAAILEADRRSRLRNRGHGNAIAQAYHHTILPLASRRDKVSEVRWGIADFRRRFGRDPEGMWLPETAADAETLEVLAREGIRFTILAPHQVDPVPRAGLPGRFPVSRSRSLAVFPYDGPLSHDVAFGSLATDAEEWARRILEEGGPEYARAGTPRASASTAALSPRLVSLATDGETYGHHHRFAEMGLAALLTRLRARPDVRVENFASFLERHPPEDVVEIVGPSSWSCIHGVERWRSACGCQLDPSRTTQQEWRKGLRAAMDWLAERIHEIFEREGSSFFADPWAAREAYGDTVVARAQAAESERPALQDHRSVPPDSRAALDFLATVSRRPLSPGERVRVFELLEMERNALRLFTSCGWFFDDLAGIEAIQILKYAARAIELAHDYDGGLRRGFLQRLDTARSNETPPRTGREIFLEEARPRVPAQMQVVAGVAAWDKVLEDAASAGVQPQAPHVPGFLTARESPALFGVIHRRTGRRWQVEALVSRATRTSLGVNVRMARPTPGAADRGEAGGDELARGGTGEMGAYSIALMDLPEVFRMPILGLLAADVVASCPLPHATTVANGVVPPGAFLDDVTLARRLGNALVAAIRDLGERTGGRIDDASAAHPANPGPDYPGGEGPAIPADTEALARVKDLAELHRLLEIPVPFDAQTDFYRLLELARPAVRVGLSMLREPLGFTSS